jgi:hypothetical protein
MVRQWLECFWGEFRFILDSCPHYLKNIASR